MKNMHKAIKLTMLFSCRLLYALLKTSSSKAVLTSNYVLLQVNYLVRLMHPNFNFHHDIEKNSHMALRSRQNCRNLHS